jgi:uvrD/REP helicase
MQNRMIKDMNPTAASPETEIAGDSGIIGILHSTNQIDEARETAKLIGRWLDDGIPANEIGILVRQHPKHMTEALTKELRERDISYRNEQDSQDLFADPVAALIFNFLWVVADDRRPEAYSKLMHLITLLDVDEDTERRFDSCLKRFIRDSRMRVRSRSFNDSDSGMWEHIVRQFLNLVSRPVLVALSPSYQQGERLDQVINNAMETFGNKLGEGNSPIDALKDLSDFDSIKIMTIHKCKGLEFKKVVVLGVEKECFWSKDSIFEFFVAISRAKEELVLTHVDHRDQPISAVNRWSVRRTAHKEFLAYAQDSRQ